MIQMTRDEANEKILELEGWDDELSFYIQRPDYIYNEMAALRLFRELPAPRLIHQNDDGDTMVSSKNYFIGYHEEFNIAICAAWLHWKLGGDRLDRVEIS